MEEDNSVETLYLDPPEHSIVEDGDQPESTVSRPIPKAFDIYSDDDSDAYSPVTDVESEGEEEKEEEEDEEENVSVFTDVESDGKESVSTTKPKVKVRTTKKSREPVKIVEIIPWDDLTKDNIDSYLNPYLSGVYESFLKTKAAGWQPIARKFRSTPYKKLEAIGDAIKKYGLCDKHFVMLFDVVVRAKLVASWKIKFIRFLLPRHKIPFQIFMEAVAFIGQFGDSLLDDEFVGWLVNVYSFIDDKEKASTMYGVVFSHLKRKDIRKHVCHLLYYMTQANHIRKQRTSFLLKLLETDKENTSVIALLMAYRQFDRTIEIPVNIRIRAQYVFKTEMVNLEQSLYDVQKLWNSRVDSIRYRDEVLVSSVDYVVKKRKGKNKALNDASKRANTLFFDTADVINKARNLEKLQVGELVRSVGDSEVLRLLITINPEGSLIQRVTSFITQELFSGLVTIGDPIRRREELKNQLKNLLNLSRSVQRQLPLADTFLLEYVKHWNGHEFVNEVFGLISFLNPLDYDVFFDCILKPLYRLFCVSNVTWKANLIKCFADLLRNWAMRDWKNFIKKKHNSTQNDDIQQITNLFDQLRLDVDYFHTIREFIHFTDKISVFGLVLENDNPTIQHACLNFFEVASSIFTEHDFPEIIIPSPAIVYRLFLSKNALAISRICDIIGQYKKAFEQNEREDEDDTFEITPEQINEFNGYLNDVCSALWLNKTFIGTETAANLRFQLSNDLIRHLDEICIGREEQLNHIGSILQSPASAGFTKRFVARYENDRSIPVHLNQPVTSSSLREIKEEGGISLTYREFKLEYLDYLSELGFTGYRELLYTSMATLRRSRESMSGFV